MDKQVRDKKESHADGVHTTIYSKTTDLITELTVQHLGNLFFAAIVLIDHICQIHNIQSIVSSI